MEPNKLENEFRKKLEQRTINPSGAAWDRLDAMLSVTEEKKKPKRTWLYIAASFLGFLLMGTLFLKQGGTNNVNDVTIGNSIVTTEKPAKAQGETVKDAPVATPQPAIQQAVENKTEEQAAVATTKPAGTKNPGKALQNKEANKNILPQMPAGETAVAVNNKQDTENKETIAVQEDEVSGLLAANTPPADTKQSIKVDAKSLLSSVEGELDESFRSKALNTVTKNYSLIKTSLANRNHK